jgi:hypothetical protein
MKSFVLASAALAAGIMIYPIIGRGALALGGPIAGVEDCSVTIEGGCVQPSQPPEEIAQVCDSPCGCTVVVNIGGGTVSYIPTPCPTPTPTIIPESPYPTSEPSPDSGGSPVPTAAPCQ